MKKFLMGLALLGVVASQVVAGDKISFEDEKGNYAIIDKCDMGKLYLSAYDANGTKTSEGVWGPRVAYASLQDMQKADDAVNKYCKGKKMKFTAGSNFICEGAEFDFIRILVKAGVNAEVYGSI